MFFFLLLLLESTFDSIAYCKVNRWVMRTENENASLLMRWFWLFLCGRCCCCLFSSASSSSPCSIRNLLNHFPLRMLCVLGAFRTLNRYHLGTGSFALERSHARIRNRPHVLMRYCLGLTVEYTIRWLSVYCSALFGYRFVNFIVTNRCVYVCECATCDVRVWL